MAWLYSIRKYRLKNRFHRFHRQNLGTMRLKEGITLHKACLIILSILEYSSTLPARRIRQKLPQQDIFKASAQGQRNDALWQQLQGIKLKRQVDTNAAALQTTIAPAGSIKGIATPTVKVTQNAVVTPTVKVTQKAVATPTVKLTQKAVVTPTVNLTTKRVVTAASNQSQALISQAAVGTTAKPASPQTATTVPTQQEILPPYTLATTKDSHAKVPTPIDVIPVQTVPTRKVVSMSVPTGKIESVSAPTSAQRNQTASKQGPHAILPLLPAHNITEDKTPTVATPHPVKTIASKPVSQTLPNTIEPVKPVTVFTRPTATVTQRVVVPKTTAMPEQSKPTEQTFQSVVVPKRKEVTPAPVLKPLGVIPPHTVPTPLPVLKPLEPLEPLSPKEPFIWYPEHIVDTVPKPCGCDPCCGTCGCPDCQCPDCKCPSDNCMDCNCQGCSGR